MANYLPLFVLVASAAAPFALIVGCGGKIAPSSQSTDGPLAAGQESSAAGTAGTSTGSDSALGPCPYDSAPLPLQTSPDPSINDGCTRFCDRANACTGCASVDCMPNCMSDALSPLNGAEYVVWMKCLLAAPPSCQAAPECTAEYCAYANAGTAPGYPVPGCP